MKRFCLVKKGMIFALGMLFFISCSTQKSTSKARTNYTASKTTQTPKKQAVTASVATGVYKKNVVAAYYHDKFNGRKTASGAIFDNNKQTAAHKELPFGTQVKVTNKANGKWVLVTINDRGPFTPGREIDLSKKAFMSITDDTKKGLLDVDIEIVKN